MKIEHAEWTKLIRPLAEYELQQYKDALELTPEEYTKKYPDSRCTVIVWEYKCYVCEKRFWAEHDPERCPYCDEWSPDCIGERTVLEDGDAT